MAQFLKVRKGSHEKEKKPQKSHWILDNPLARRSLKGTVERDTVKGSLWRPVQREKQGL